MKKKYNLSVRNHQKRTPFAMIIFIIAATATLLYSEAFAYQKYNDGCHNCHGQFIKGISSKRDTIEYNENNKQQIHRNPYAMSTACKLCHTKGDKNNPYIGSSTGFSDIPGRGCVGCHGREEDAGNDSISNGLGAGLRQHHWNADVIIDTDIGTLSSQVCADCHTDANPANYTPVGEHVKPAYYGSDKTNADNPCNPLALHEVNENWDSIDLKGLDNDGDLLYDGADPDCAVCVPTGTPETVCNGVDDDCDSLIDEDFVSNPKNCGAGECFSTGMTTCVGGVEGNTCVEGTPVPEACNDSLDNDCDGEIDDLDVCGCIPTGLPENVCDGIDDDCDGSIDEDYMPMGTTCGTGVCTATGQMTCIDGLEYNTCTAGTPSSESCDGLDNDCDGTIDEDFTDLGTTCSVGAGACETIGSYICIADGSGTECNATPGSPSVEGPEGDPTCSDTIDNDCDGQADTNDADCLVVCTTPPPVRQEIGVQDGLYNSLVEEDCRFCHENPEQFPVQDLSVPDRHHLLVDTIISDPSDAPYGTPGNLYECLSCHEVDDSSGIFIFIVERDCPACHIQVPSGPTVHHRTDLAQGNVPQGPDCQACHGDIVDNRDDGHYIPVFDPMPETPRRSGGTGLPFNCRGDGAGACNYCHDNGISPNGIPVETTMTTHHSTGLGSDAAKCDWCHDFALPFEAQIRICENCHGRDSLHNIQADSNGDNIINPGIELPFYGHIGNPDDCWGCHGYGPAALTAPETGPVVPSISSISDSVMTEGADMTVTLSGSAFTNLDKGAELYSEVVLTAQDGSSITLAPDSISQDSITVTIPGTLEKGNYKLKTVKLNKSSNPLVISVIPDVIITNVDCNKKSGLLTIAGSGFGEMIEGTDDYISVEVDDTAVDIISWTDDHIKASVSMCSNSNTVIVNSLYGSAAICDKKSTDLSRDKYCND